MAFNFMRLHHDRLHVESPSEYDLVVQLHEEHLGRLEGVSHGLAVAGK